MLKSLWAGLGRGARAGFVVGVGVILMVTVAIAIWLLRTDYDVLFANLSAADAAAMTHELDQMKVPYQLAAEGTSIMVDRASVHQTRLKLMGKDLPLHGAVGFELFNNSDFGMTEFAQKVNYQRALQGELTRTILSLSEVESVRVHLAFPEEGLFKREQGRAKASITLALHRGQALRREQVRGIQRLVSAAIPGTQSHDVTIINEQGVALTQDSEESGPALTSLRLELKREIEQALAQKANTILEKAFGPGQALASVDVALNMDQVKVTTEDVTTPPAAGGGSGAVGVVVRERETVRDTARARANPDETGNGGSTQREFDYQVGRRVEQVVSSPGAVSRIHALAIIRAPLNASQAEQVRKLLASAVGITMERGDTVVVQTLDGLAASTAAEAVGVSNTKVDAPVEPSETRREVSSQASRPWSVDQGLSVLLLAALVGVGLYLGFGRQAPTRPAVPLTEQQRQDGLAQIQAWLQADSRPSGDKGL